jgi:hypothetical protein
MQKPRTDEHRSVESYIDNEAPLCDGENKFIYAREDLVTLASVRERREVSLLQAPFERFLRAFHSRLTEVREPMSECLILLMTLQKIFINSVCCPAVRLCIDNQSHSTSRKQK